jgi:hypothetical protein
VVKRDSGAFVGMIALADLLKARAQILEAEERRERVFGQSIRLPATLERLMGR